ncbi:MAG: Tol-Pal system beta propeller repeat protein TolB, partial [Acidobacteriota bacterium]
MKRTLPILFCAVLAAPGVLPAQERELHTGISESGFSPIRLAVPAFVGRSEAAAVRSTVDELAEVVWADLDFSGYFRLVEREYYSLIPEPGPNPLPFEDWESIGAEYLLQGEVGLEGARILVESRLYDTTHSERIFGKRYRAEPGIWRTVAHRIADDIVLHFIGRKGIASSQLVFSARNGDGKEIFTMDYDGAGLQQITNNGSLNLSPAWSPDGAQLAFISYQEGWPRLYLLDREGKQSRPLPSWEDELTSAPEWSPDGRWLAFASNRDGNSEIYKLEMSTGRLVRLTYHRLIDSSPTWSPNGRELAFTSSRGGTPQIYAMDADGLNVRRLTFEGSYNDLAAWSPQGDRIAYAGRKRTFDIHVLDVATGQSRQITHGPGNNEDPRWSPDGQHLVFSSTRAGDQALYIMDANGGRVRQVGPFGG